MLIVPVLSAAMAFTALAALPALQISVEGLVYDLKSPDAQRRREAAAALGRNKSREAVPQLLEASQDSDESVRAEVILALVAIGDPRALPAYVRALDGSANAVRHKAIEGIVNVYVVEESGLIASTRKLIGAINPFGEDYNNLRVEPYARVSPEVVQAVAALLRDDSTSIRKSAAQALGILRGRGAVAELSAALKVETDPGTKVEIIRAFEKIGDPESGHAIVPYVRDSDKRTHDQAIYTLGVLRYHAAAPQLIELFSSGVEERRRIFKIIPASGADDLQQKLLQSLALMGAPEARAIFLNHLDHADTLYRQYAAEGLARLYAPDLATTISKARITEDKPNVQAALSFALYQSGREEYLLELVNGLLDSRRDQVAGYLRELTPEQTRQLYPYLRSRDDDVREQVALAIGYSADASALPELEKMFRDPDADVVSAVNLSVRRLRARTSP